MSQKLSIGPTRLFIFVVFFNIFFSVSLHSSLAEIRGRIEKIGVFYGCNFGLFNSDEHEAYYENLNERKAIYTPLWERLYYELAPHKLDYFYQFKERIHVTRQFAAYKKDEADYCIVYARDFDVQKNYWDKKRYEKWYEEDRSKCNANYKKYIDKVDNLEDIINEEFLRLYSLKSYPNNSREVYDYGLVQLANGNLAEAVILADDFLEKTKQENKAFTSKQLLDLGVTYNEAMEYSKAIESLNASIEQDPSNKEAYFQRAIAYLETGYFSKSINDFLISEKSKNVNKIETIPPIDFTVGFIDGMGHGSKEAIINFLPSLYSFMSLSVTRPIDSLSNFINACYAHMCITEEYLMEVDWINGQLDVPIPFMSALLEPGLKRLYENMKDLSPKEQGYLLGHSIGLYGTDFIAGAGIFKGLSHCAKFANASKAVRETCRIYELEVLSYPAVETDLIFAEAAESIITAAAERAIVRDTILQGAKNGRIVIRDANVQFHIMQEKHAWEKLFKLTGIVEKDCQTVMKFLEEINICSEECLVESRTFSNGAITRSDYKMDFNGYKIQAVFETNLIKNETFLKDAWVITIE